MATNRPTPAGFRTARSPEFAPGAAGHPRPRPSRAWYRGNWRSGGSIALALLTLAACAPKTSPDEPLLSVRVGEESRGYVPVRLAAVAADEPAAAEAASRMLSAGGTAADAAAAAGFVMAVALPSRAGLAGGGVCLLYDADRKSVRTIDFAPRGEPGGVAVPTLAAGLSAMHGMKGRLRWPQVVTPAEQLMRGATPLSRAAAESWAEALRDPGVAAILLPDGRAPREGERMVRPELVETLTRIRTQLAPGQVVADQVAQAVGTDAGRFRATADVRDAVEFVSGDDRIYLPTAAMPDSAMARVRTAVTAPSAQRAERLAEALRAIVQTGAPPAATVAVVDRFENSAACALTMGGRFGARRGVAGTGMILGAAVAPTPAALAIAINPALGDTLFVGAARPNGAVRVACRIAAGSGAKRCDPEAEGGGIGLRPEGEPGS
jgi:gamma-glutamyltranspeptidase/glutathione hydrolase